MPRLWKPFFLIPFALLALLAAGVSAQPPPSQPAPPQTPAVAAKADTAKAAAAIDEEVLPIRHPRPFGLFVRGSWLMPVHILKENQRNINDITRSSAAFDGGVCWYPLDGLRVSARTLRGGLKMTDNAYDLLGHVEPNDTRFEITPALGPDSFLKLDTYSLTASAFLGNALFPGSRFNPYLTGLVSRVSWRLSTDGRGGDPHAILQVPLEGKDLGVGGGIGTEYQLGGSFLLDAEWTWQYVFTSLSQDVTQNKSQFDAWSNTHFWDFSLGLIFTF